MKKSIRQVQYYLIALILIIIGSSCKKQEKQTRTTKVVQATKPTDKKQGKKKNLLRFYEKQIRQFYLDFIDVGLDGIMVMPPAKQEKYVDIAAELCYDALLKFGFQPVSTEEAQRAIKKYFNIDITADNATLSKYGFRRYIYKDGNPTGRAEQKLSFAAESYEQPTFFWYKTIFFPKYNFLMTFPSIGQVVGVEGMGEIDGEDSEYYAKKGKLEYDHEYFDPTYYINEFIFHDSKVAFNWLKKNDNFLENLFEDYGYDKSDAINKMMIDKVIKRKDMIPFTDDYKELFAGKGINKKLLIHEGLLKYMLRHANEENNYFCIVDQYLDEVLDIKYKPNYKDLTIEERYKIAAYVGYYYGLMYEKCIGTPCDCNSFGASLYYDKGFMAFIKRNNYFGLKGFKKIIEEQYDRYQEGVAVLEHRSSGE